MKTEKQISNERERLFRLFMDLSNKKPLRDDAHIRFDVLTWILQDEEDIIERRLKEIATGNKAPQTQ